MEKITISFGNLLIEVQGVSTVSVSIFFLALAAFSVSAVALYAKKKIAYDSETKQQSAATLIRKM